MGKLRYSHQLYRTARTGFSQQYGPHLRHSNVPRRRYPNHRQYARYYRLPASKSRWPQLQHEYRRHVAQESPDRAAKLPRPRLELYWCRSPQLRFPLELPHLLQPIRRHRGLHQPLRLPALQRPQRLSEPESQNAMWIFDNFPNIGFFIDCHSYNQDILYSWGDDEDQSTDPTMNFQNPACNGQRGVSGDAYKEYIPSNDLTTAIHLANTFHDGIQALRGTDYTVKPSFNLYPTAGTSDDYAYSRHFVDASKNKILAYTLEWGLEFQPVYSEMQNIIQEITSGLLAFCLEVRKSVTDCVIITDRNTFGKDEIDALLQLQNPAEIDVAFYIIVDGFSANELGITAASFSGTPNVHPNISFDTTLNGMSVQATALSAPDESNFSSPQRFTWTYQVIFSNDHDFTGESVPITMTASMPNTPDIPASGQAVFTLTTQPNPYEIDGPSSWLSVDLQVFNVLDGGHLSGTPGIVLNSGPLNFIRALLANTGQGYNNPALPRAPNHPFDIDLVANEDTSAVELSEKIGATNVYNFAVARVRYRALTTPAANVRVFFRMFQASTTSTEYQPTT